MEQPIQQQEQHLLETLCQKTHSLGVFCARKERDGVFTIQASWGISSRLLQNLEDKLAFTAVANAIEQSEELERPLFKASFLQESAPALATYVWVWPIRIHEQPDRALAFFCTGRLNDADKDKVRQELPRFVELAERLTLVQYVTESEAFATLGRTSAALLHDLRVMAGPTANSATRILNLLGKGSLRLDYIALRTELEKIAQQLQRIAQLATGNLAYIQKDRTERIRVNETVERIISIVKHQGNNPYLMLEFTPCPGNLVTSLPPAVLEQPLINLLDNAIYHVGNRRWGRIQVKVFLDFKDPERPIVIRVEDNGYGMNASQKQTFYTPRITAKGNAGYGMGIYVSYNLLRSVGGDLQIEKSVRWLGSQLAIKLPICFG
ncbi:MAG: HAMP domain-containing histidine kinase [Magnetococcus sp. YQC-5]